MELPKRKKNRLKNYEYSQNGAYFVTVCTQNRKEKLCKIVVGDGFPVPKSTHFGVIVDKYINLISKKYLTVNVDKYVIMPNHIHLILLLNDNGTGNPSPTIGMIVAWLKYQTTKQINEYNKTVGLRQFQRSYHDHIIRNERDYQKIWEYIDTNPLKWENDCFYNS